MSRTKQIMPGIAPVKREPSRGLVRALLCGANDEAKHFVEHHKDNEAWLKIALELEEARKPKRWPVIQAIREALAAHAPSAECEVRSAK